MKKKIVSALILALALTSAIALTGCGSKESDEKVIKVGATPAPHAEALEVVKDKLAEEGYTLLSKSSNTTITFCLTGPFRKER